jgi:hypothetical protein
MLERPSRFASVMRPKTLIPIVIVLGLGAFAASVEYGQYSSLMLRTASADVAGLCATLKSARVCPKPVSFPTRAVVDPWSHDYRCRSSVGGLMIYTLGADDALAGSGRDADIVCTSPYVESENDDNSNCACAVGDEATALLH